MRRLLVLVCLVVTACGDGGGGDDDAPVEDCANGVDDDGDHAADCLDTQCAGSVACLACGDGIISTGEQCDGVQLAGQTCESRGFAGGGTLACGGDCKFDTSGCASMLENCENGVDDDGDMKADCLDSQCMGTPACTGITENCSNGLDDDGDMLVDCNDPNCAGVPVCTGGGTETNCVNGLDDDGDSFYDCEDSDCFADISCLGPTTETFCDDLSDDEGDGLIDCQDPDCTGKPACVPGMKPVGDACTLNTECAAVAGGDPICITPDANPIYEGGYCTEFCTMAPDDCPATARCVDVGTAAGTGVCFDRCDGPADCRAGYQCLGFNGAAVCTPIDEMCENGIDDDADAVVDCMDSECAGDGACTMNPGGDCSMVPAITPGMPVSDTTVGAADSGTGSCEASSGLGDRRYLYTPATDAHITLTLNSATDQGISIYEQCGAIERLCVDASSGGFDETLDLDVVAGKTYMIRVDAYFSGEEGPFTLTLAETAQPTGPACAGAPAGALGASMDDTTGGTELFTALCGGHGAEDLVGFTPAATGTLRATVTSTADLVIYARSTCNDAATELRCGGYSPAGQPEIIFVPVTAGVPVMLYVDGQNGGDQGAYTLDLTML